MKQAEIEIVKHIDDKAELCQELERLQRAVNVLAMDLCTGQGSQLNYIWTNLAQARACLATALEASRALKDGHLPGTPSDWQI